MSCCVYGWREGVTYVLSGGVRVLTMVCEQQRAVSPIVACKSLNLVHHNAPSNALQNALQRFLMAGGRTTRTSRTARYSRCVCVCGCGCVCVWLCVWRFAFCSVCLVMYVCAFVCVCVCVWVMCIMCTPPPPTLYVPPLHHTIVMHTPSVVERLSYICATCLYCPCPSAPINMNGAGRVPCCAALLRPVSAAHHP